MAGHAQLKFVMMECSKTQIRLTGPKWCDNLLDFIFRRSMTKLTKWSVLGPRHRSAFVSPIKSLLFWVLWFPKKVHSKDSDETGQVPRLILVFAWHTDHFAGFVVCLLIFSGRIKSWEKVQNNFAVFLSWSIAKPTKWQSPSEDSDQFVHLCSLISLGLTLSV